MKTTTISAAVTLSCPTQGTLSSDAKNLDPSVSVIEVRMAPLWMCNASVYVYHFTRHVSTGYLAADRKLLNKTSHVQSISIITIGCHISSDVMVITCLTQILWRAQV